MQAHWSELERHKSLFSYAVIPGANHILGEPEAVREANRLTGLWLDAVLAESRASRALDWSLVPASRTARRLSPAA